MTSRLSASANRAVQVLISVAVAALLVALATGLRAALAPYLGVLSPFMIYVAAVLLAGLIRGALCGALAMLAGGLVGYQLFLANGAAPPPGAVISLMLFWGVSAPVLVTANELRVQLGTAMRRLSEALKRGDSSPPT
jgi:K+-sensing histidine kinase KdpD